MAAGCPRGRVQESEELGKIIALQQESSLAEGGCPPRICGECSRMLPPPKLGVHMQANIAFVQTARQLYILCVGNFIKTCKTGKISPVGNFGGSSMWWLWLG